MRSIKSLVALGIFILPLCTQPVTYRIDITPRDSNDLFEMEVNTTVTFNVVAYKEEEDATTETEVAIDKLWWNFDKSTLTKISSSLNSITLKATKSGISNLTAIAMLKNQNCAKTITILVKETLLSDKTTRPKKKR